MPDNPPLRRLLEWSLAGFHAAFLFAALITLLYAGGGLGGLLGALNTLLGLGLYAVFWLTTWWTTRRATRGLSWPALNKPWAPLGHLGRVVLWAAVNGLLLFAAILGLILASLAGPILGGGTQPGDTLGFLVGLLVVGTLVSAVLGAVAGVFFALLDSLVLALARRLVPD